MCDARSEEEGDGRSLVLGLGASRCVNCVFWFRVLCLGEFFQRFGDNKII